MMLWIKGSFKKSIVSIFLILLLTILISQLVKADVENQSTNEVDTEIEQKGVSIKTFGAKGDGITDDTSAIRDAFNSDEGNLYFPKGIYKVTAPIVVKAGKTRSVTGETDAVISAHLAAKQNLFTLYRSMSFKNMEFDFNNGSLQYGIYYQEDIGEISLENLKFRNIIDTNNTLGTIVVYVQAKGTQLTAENIYFDNMFKKGNGIIGDGAGNLTCLHIRNPFLDSEISTHIKGIKIVNVHNIDNNNNIMFEDTSGIYISDSGMPKNNKILIEDIYGHNFGKRLIKLQASNVEIRKVEALSESDDSFSVISVLADPQSTDMNKNNTITDVKVQGKFNVALASSSKNTIFRDINIDIERPNLAGNSPVAYGVRIAGGNTLVENGTVKAEYPLKNLTEYGGELQVENVTVFPTKETVVVDGTAPAVTLTSKVTHHSTRVIGTADADTKIVVKAGTNSIGTATANANGKYEVSIVKQKVGTKLSITATETSANSSKAIVVTVVDGNYPDLKLSHWALDEIMYLADDQIIGGYPNGNFQPEKNTTRAEAAKMLALALDLPINDTFSGYKDVTSKHWAKDYIAAVSKAGLFNGNPDGTFAPNDVLKRAEMAKVISIAHKLDASDKNHFSDVTTGHWAKGYISGLYENDITTGFPDKTFRPGASTTRAEYSVFLARALNEDFR